MTFPCLCVCGACLTIKKQRHNYFFNDDRTQYFCFIARLISMMMLLYTELRFSRQKTNFVKLHSLIPIYLKTSATCTWLLEHYHYLDHTSAWLQSTVIRNTYASLHIQYILKNRSLLLLLLLVDERPVYDFPTIETVLKCTVSLC